MRLRCAVGEEGTRAEVEAYKAPSSKGSKGGVSHSSSSSSGSTTLGDLLNWKKSERE
ncbi:MAG: hypothetical protein ACYCSN_08700 [Acidobacteriaceae bacterium]